MKLGLSQPDLALTTLGQVRKLCPMAESNSY